MTGDDVIGKNKQTVFKEMKEHVTNVFDVVSGI